MQWRVMFFLFGLLLMGLGTSITVLSSFGTSFWNAISVGLQRNLGFTVGTWFSLIQVIAAIINAVLLRKRPDFFAALTVVLSGLSIDFWIEIVFKHISFADSPMDVQAAVFVCGLLLLGLSIGMIVVSNFSPLPVDKLAFVFHERFSWNLAYAQMAIAVFVVIIAFFLNGPVGLGTLISVFSMGYIIKFSHKKTSQLLHKLDS
jgi:uncharacterized membrane protein YczE